MLYVLGDAIVDPQKRAIYRGVDCIQPEARIFDLAYLLVSQHDRMVSKDEIVDTVWNGRAVSDNAISTAVKDLRKLLGDDGRNQNVIRTIHGQGFRCVARVQLKKPDTSGAATASARDGELHPIDAPTLRGKPSIAVLPFQDMSYDPGQTPIAHAVPTELISAFSRLRWLAVTARGSSFRFTQGNESHETVRDLLNVQYLLSGSVEVFDKRLQLMVELVETQAGRVIWSDQFNAPLDEIHDIRSRITAAVVTALEIHIPSHEAELARSMPPENLDAWAAYHLGLQHVYRFNRADNEIAMGHFRSAIAKQPDFSRAHAGLSFGSFQNAFLNYTPDREGQIRAARSHAERGMELDALDPFANYNMGRSCWLTGEIEAGASWMDRSTEISPNFAQGHYAGSLMRVLSGQSADARLGNGLALLLSPLDPLRYAMMSTHSMTYMNEDRFDDAVFWAERGARAPGAHHLAKTTAAIACELAGNRDAAGRWLAEARNQCVSPLSATGFFRSFPYVDADARRRVEMALNNLGLD